MTKYSIDCNITDTCNLELHDKYDTLQGVFDFFSGFISAYSILRVQNTFKVDVIDDTTFEVTVKFQNISKNEQTFLFVVKKEEIPE